MPPLFLALVFLAAIHCHASDRFEIKPSSPGDASIPESAYTRRTEDRDASLRDHELAQDNMLRLQTADEAEEDQSLLFVLIVIAGVVITRIIIVVVRQNT